MINPYNITKFDRSKSELEEFLLFAIIVAGKTAYIQANKLELFLNKCKIDYEIFNLTPFEILKWLNSNDKLDKSVIECKLGQYNKIIKSFKYLANNNLDLNTCTIEDLEIVPGVGPKTSRFFLLHSRKIDVAVLDVHILKWIANLGYTNVPKTTPSNKKSYKKWEQIFLKYCKENDKDPAILDLEIWKSYAKRGNYDEL